MKINTFNVNKSYLRSTIECTKNVLEHSNRSRIFAVKFHHNFVRELLINIVLI